MFVSILILNMSNVHERVANNLRSGIHHINNYNQLNLMVNSKKRINKTNEDYAYDEQDEESKVQDNR